MRNKSMLLVSLSLIFLTLTACAKPQTEMVVDLEWPTGLRSPAEVYCTGLGYEHITRELKIDKPGSRPETPDSKQLGVPVRTVMPVAPDYFLETVCVIPDGNECEEEEFVSGRCGQEYSYCVLQGYRLEPGSTLEPGVNSATCIFPNGSSCPEFEFFNGNCGPAAIQLSDTEWELISLNGKDLIAGTAITLYFSNDYLGGEMGCNGYGGTLDTGKYQAKSDGTFTLGSPFAVTVQLCPEPEGIMEQETAYIETLIDATQYQIVDDRLEIKDEAGEIMLVYQQR